MGVGRLRVALRALYSAEPCSSTARLRLLREERGSEHSDTNQRPGRAHEALATAQTSDVPTGADETPSERITSAHHTCALARSQHEREEELFYCVWVV